MFSMSPRTGSPTLRVKERDLEVSRRETAWGVVMMTEDRREESGWRWVMRDRCSSEVPTCGRKETEKEREEGRRKSWSA